MARDFPGGPEVKILHFRCRGLGSPPGQGNKILNAAKPERKKKKKRLLQDREDKQSLKKKKGEKKKRRLQHSCGKYDSAWKCVSPFGPAQASEENAK